MGIDFKTLKMFLIIFDIIIIPALIYQVIKGSYSIAEWIVLILANIGLIFVINKKKREEN